VTAAFARKSYQAMAGLAKEIPLALHV